MEAITATFSVEIEDIIFISNSYEKDCKFIEAGEAYFILEYIDDLGRENVYNVKLDGSGGHVSYIRSGHAEEELYATINNMIAEGFSIKEIANYLDVLYHPDRYTTIHQLIKKATDKFYTQARLELIGERMIRLIGAGYYSFPQLASFFKGMDALEVLRFFSGKNFKLGNEYLKGFISSAILKLKKDGKIIGAQGKYGLSYRTIGVELGVNKYGVADSLAHFMKREMKVITKITNEDLVNGLKYYASKLITKSENAFDLLNMLNYDEGIRQHYHKKIAQRIDKLFKLPYEDAFKLFSSNKLNLHVK